MTKQQRINEINQRDRVFGFYDEKHEATRGDITIYQLGVQVFTTEWDEQAEDWTKQYLERHTLYLTVKNEGREDAQGNSIEEAHWEAKNIQHTEWPDLSKTAFEEAVERKITELEGDGTIIQTISKTLYPANNVVVLRAIVADGTSGSKEVNRLAKWDEQGDTWTLKVHTPANG